MKVFSYTVLYKFTSSTFACTYLFIPKYVGKCVWACDDEIMAYFGVYVNGVGSEREVYICVNTKACMV